MSDINLKELSLEQITERKNKIIETLLYLSRTGRKNTQIFNQLKSYLQDIEIELREKYVLDNEDLESGTVTIIGEKPDD